MGFTNWRQSYRIGTQTLFVFFITSTIIFLILFAILILGQQIINNLLMETSGLIFQRQTQKIMNNIWIYKHGVEELIARTKQDMSSVSKLNNYVNKIESLHIQSPAMCLLEAQDMDSLCFNNSMCCGVFGEKIDENQFKKNQNLLKTTSLLNEFRLEYDVSTHSPILLIFKTEAQIHCNSNGFSYPTQFEPFERPYYLEHLQKFQYSSPYETYFVGPYIILKKLIRCSITASLLDENNKLIGMGAKDLDFDYSLIDKHYLNSFTKYIITENGQVVFSEKYKIHNIPVFFLNDSVYSGFNNDDYTQIMLQFQGLSFKGNCEEFQSNNILCLFNSDSKENLIVQTSRIQESPLIMVILYKIDSLKLEEKQHIYFLNQQVKQMTNQLILIFVLCTLFIIAIGYLINVLILRQLNNIIQQIGNQIKISNINKFRTIQLMNSFLVNRRICSTSQQPLIRSDTITKLLQSFVKLFHESKSFIKFKECLHQELIQYPEICKPMMKNMKFIKKEICNLNSSEFQFSDSDNNKRN